MTWVILMNSYLLTSKITIQLIHQSNLMKNGRPGKTRKVRMTTQLRFVRTRSKMKKALTLQITRTGRTMTVTMNAQPIKTGRVMIATMNAQPIRIRR